MSNLLNLLHNNNSDFEISTFSDYVNSIICTYMHSWPLQWKLKKYKNEMRDMRVEQVCHLVEKLPKCQLSQSVTLHLFLPTFFHYSTTALTVICAAALGWSLFVHLEIRKCCKNSLVSLHFFEVLRGSCKGFGHIFDGCIHPWSQTCPWL